MQQGNHRDGIDVRPHSASRRNAKVHERARPVFGAGGDLGSLFSPRFFVYISVIDAQRRLSIDCASFSDSRRQQRFPTDACMVTMLSTAWTIPLSSFVGTETCLCCVRENSPNWYPFIKAACLDRLFRVVFFQRGGVQPALRGLPARPELDLLAKCNQLSCIVRMFIQRLPHLLQSGASLYAEGLQRIGDTRFLMSCGLSV